jgi:serine/threonine protein phosphatase PrpC
MRLVVEHATRPKPGEAANGDAVLVRREPDRALVAVIDALGHGAEAAAVAAQAVAFLAAAPLGGAEALLRGLHEALKKTRGAAATLFVLAGDRVEGGGVGNVELRAPAGRLPAGLSDGILGLRLPRVRIFEGRLCVGDRLVVFSDGVAGRFSRDELARLPARVACEYLLSRYAKAHDDATALVADLEAAR